MQLRRREGTKTCVTAPFVNPGNVLPVTTARLNPKHPKTESTQNQIALIVYKTADYAGKKRSKSETGETTVSGTRVS